MPYSSLTEVASVSAAAPAREETYIFPLSYSQRRLWFTHQLEPASSAYNMPLNVLLAGAVNIPALQASLNEIVRRHEALRTTFTVRDGEPVQEIHSPAEVTIPVTDLSGLPADERDRAARKIRQDEWARPFNLETGPLLRLKLVRLDSRECQLLMVTHHIVSDGWSEGVFIRELHTLYDAFSKGKSSPLPELQIQYADYSLWLRDRLERGELDQQIDYWRQTLAGISPLHLPTDFPRPRTFDHTGDMVRFEYPPQLRASLNELAQQEGATLFMALLACFALLLYKYTGQDDIGVGTVTANRNPRQTEELIGFFANTLVLRARLGGNPTFRELLRRVRTVALDAYANQDVPFDKLVEELNPERHPGEVPLIQTGLALQNAPLADTRLGDLQISSLDTEFKNSFVDFGLSLSEDVETGGLSGVAVYSTGLFARSTMERLVRRYEHLLSTVASNPDAPVGNIELLTAVERQRWIVDWNRTAVEYPAGNFVPTMFEEQARIHPSTVAVSHEGTELTYGDLNRQANRIANHLLRLGVVPDARVAILLERSPAAVTVLMAVFKAGGAYVPLDPMHPAERVKLVLQNSQAGVLITTAELRDKFGDALNVPGLSVLCLDDCCALALESDSNPEAQIAPQNLAYIIYTSGSTGEPKGVMVVHAGLANVIQASIELLRVTPLSRAAQLASLTFDASVAEIFTVLCGGGTVCMISPHRLLSGADFVGVLQQEAVSILGCVPSILGMLSPDYFPALQTVVVGGESCPPATAERWLSRCRLLNAYAPTEATIYSTLSECRAAYETGLPMGQPIANARMYLLDRDLNPLPPGITGEICIGGTGVTRGYAGLPGVTAQAFIPDPFSEEASARLYRTGDLGRFRADGTIEFLGRADDQVKIRGHRIELGEIEAALRRIPGVQQCVVIVREDQPGNQRLTAYFTPDSGAQLTGSDLRATLRSRLPEYMIPSAYVPLRELPLNGNGKVDRRALPEPPASNDETYAPPRSATEHMLAEIWKDVLGVERVGVNDNFFQLGGHSLLATRVVTRARAAGLSIPLSLIFESPTLADLAARIEEPQANTAAPVPLTIKPRLEEFPPLSFSQQRLWLLDQMDPASRIYNVSVMLRIRGELRVDILEAALCEIVRRHEVLRTSFPVRDGQPYQRVAPTGGVCLEQVDLTAAPGDKESRARELALAAIGQPFDLANGPLLRLLLFALDKQDYVFCFAVHHIVFDAGSTRIFVSELATLYTAYLNGDPSPLPELPVQCADVASWERNWLRGEVLDRHLDYWRARLDGYPAALELAADRTRPAVQSLRAGVERVTLPIDLLREVEQLGRATGATDFMTILALLNVWLSHYSSQSDILVGSPVANRNQLETEGLIGFFVNTLVFRTRIDPNQTISQLLREVRSNSLEAYAHQALPFDQLVNELHAARETDRHPLFQVLFNMVSDADTTLELPGLQVEGIDSAPVQTPFDLGIGAYTSSAGLEIVCTYSQDLFDSRTIASMLRLLAELMRVATANPQASIREIAWKLDRFQGEEALRQEREHSGARVDEMKKFRRRTVSAAPAQAKSLPSIDAVETRNLVAGSLLPLLVRPTVDGLDLASWAVSKRDWINQRLLEHGGILFRGFRVENPVGLTNFATAVSGELLEYKEQTSPRSKVNGNIYKSTEYPPQYPIFLHNENSYSSSWPLKIMFFCVTAPEEGGETPIADSRRVLTRIPAAIVDRFVRDRWMLVRNFGSGYGLSWQVAFQTENPEDVNRHCLANGIEYEWLSQSRLRIRQRHSAVSRHPVSGEPVWFNHAAFFHISTLDPAVRAGLESQLKEEDLPYNTYYGDGSAIPLEVVEALRGAYRQETISFPWQQNDLLLLDNMLAAHGRAPFRGPRNILVGMTEAYSPRD